MVSYSRLSPSPRQAARGIPWMLWDSEVRLVLMSVWASIQTTLSWSAGMQRDETGNRADSQRVVAADNKGETSLCKAFLHAVRQLAAGGSDLLEIFHGRFGIFIFWFRRNANQRDSADLVAAPFCKR